MAKYICNVETIVTGLETFEFLRKMTESWLSSEFMELRNKVVEELNPNYEKWNDEYNELYEAEEEDCSISERYHQFISDKQDEILKTFDNSKKNQKIVIRSNEENCDLVGYGKEGSAFEGVKIEMIITDMVLI